MLKPVISTSSISQAARAEDESDGAGTGPAL
jgi:hypothetical protein